MAIVVSCDECGSDTEKQKHQLEAHDHNFCSTKCHNKFQSKSVEQKCEECGNTFTTKSYNTRKYCNKSCRKNARTTRVTVECDICGELVEYHQYRIENQDSFYCSSDCREKHLSNKWIGEKNPQYNDGRNKEFGSNWRKFQERVRERANGICEGCGKSRKLNGRKLDVHHVVPRSFFIESDKHTVEDSNSMENLVALCQSCHAKEEPVCQSVLENIIL